MLDEWASSSERTPAGFDEVPRDRSSEDDKIFTLDLLEQNASKNHGLITSVAAGNNVVVVGTSKGWIVRHDFGTDEKRELDLRQDQYVHKVFLDPSGRHCIATVRSGTSVESFYHHAKWKKPRALGKLKNIVINAIAWNKSQVSDASSGEIVIGTMGGQIYEMLIEERDQKEKYVKLLFELEVKEPITGIQMDSLTSTSLNRYYVMVVTSTKQYTFSGSGTLEAVFAAYAERPVKFRELPGDSPKSELHFFGKRHAESFAWSAGPGVLHGQLVISTTQQSEDNFIGNKWLLEYSKINEDGSNTPPTAISLTEHHILLLYEGRLKAVNRLSQKLVEEEHLDTHYDANAANMLGLCADYAAGAYYAFTDSSIFEITVRDEDRDIWLIYLEMKEYAAAREHCRNSLQKDRVYEAQADAAFEARKFTMAASFYAKINSAVLFEEIAIKFLKINEWDALRAFLLRKLDELGKNDRSQITMVATWATELYLHKINSLLLDGDKEHEDAEGGVGDEYTGIIKEFKAFLSDCKDVLDEATTMKLLASYGRNEELVYFAGLKNQYETVVNHYVQQRNAKKALAVLKRGNVPPELLYKFAPALMTLDPKETVDFLISFGGLNAQEFIPALMRYSEEPRQKDEPHQALRYLEFCIQRQQNESQTIHDLMVLFLVKQGDERALVKFLKMKNNKESVFYNPNHALRLCLEEKCLQACVFLYSMMGLHEEAVALALKVDVDLAKIEAEKVEDDEGLRKKLWLIIAKHVIKEDKGTKRENIKKAVAFVNETDGLLKIEDILPFFPDFALINDFQEAISASLQEYNAQIEELKSEMNEATLGAEKLRNDIAALSQRHAVIEPEDECGVCGKKVLALENAQATYYTFPCEHSFHDECLVSHVMKHGDKVQKDRIMELKKKLSVLSVEASVSSKKQSSKTMDDNVPAVSSLDEVLAKLDDIVAAECPYCGEMMIREISRPFVKDEDDPSSWEIRGL